MMGDAQGLRWVLMIGCLAVFAGVFALMLGSIWRHHRRQTTEQANFHASMVVEMCWALAPFAIVVALVYPAVRGVWGG